jgi:plasmid stabilization system protein ParE
MLVRILPDAEADLEDIGDYIARDNPLRAHTFVTELRTLCMDLADMPLSFPLVPKYESHGVRVRVHGRYNIFYRVIGVPLERVDVLHVMHGARNYAALLF